MLILSLESSTSAAKALLYDTRTRTTRMETQNYLPDYNSPDGCQNAEGIFRQTVETGKKLCRGEKIDMIALVGAWHSVMLCDADGTPQTPVYSWAATHAKDICAGLRKDPAAVNAYYQKTGCMVNAIYPYFKLLYLRAQGYDLSRFLIMGQGSYNTYRLTGVRCTSDCMASGSGLMNIHEKRYDAALLDSLGIREGQLSAVRHFDQTVPLSEDGARLLGLEPGIPLIPACSDGGMNQMAIGGYRSGIMSFSVGTSAAIRLSTARPVLPSHPATWCYLSPIDYLSGAATSGACNCISWYKNSFLPDTGFDEIERAYDCAADTPVFLPFMFGERCPGWDDARKGQFAEIHAGHTPLNFYQAICEGILFNVYQCYRHLTEANADKPRIILSGGILNSPNWTQMCADIFNESMEIPENQQSSLWGGIVLAVKHALGDAEADLLIGGNRRVTPDAARHEIYMCKYEAYLRQYALTAK